LEVSLAEAERRRQREYELERRSERGEKVKRSAADVMAFEGSKEPDTNDQVDNIIKNEVADPQLRTFLRRIRAYYQTRHMQWVFTMRTSDALHDPLGVQLVAKLTGSSPQRMGRGKEKCSSRSRSDRTCRITFSSSRRLAILTGCTRTRAIWCRVWSAATAK
jgi:hypothetical protein